MRFPTQQYAQGACRQRRLAGWRRRRRSADGGDVADLDANNVGGDGFVLFNSIPEGRNQSGAPWDDNLVYSPHKYWSTNTAETMQWVTTMRNEHNVPLYLGESGENSNVW